MNKLEQAARQALEALEYETSSHKSYNRKPLLSSLEAITALRDALAEQAEQEPVVMDESWCLEPQPVNGLLSNEQVEQEPVGVVEGSGEWGIAGVLVAGVSIGTKLYAAPVRTKDLTDDEIAYIWRKYRDHITSTLGFARAVIAADREKNK